METKNFVFSSFTWRLFISCLKIHVFCTSLINPLNANTTNWPNTQTIRRQFADELFECVWPFCDVDA